MAGPRRRLFRPAHPSTAPGWVALRVGWAAASVFVVESLVLGLAIMPAAVFYQWHLDWSLSPWWVRGVLLGAATVPAYLIFAHLLMALSALACRGLGWRPEAGQVMPLAEMGWPLLDWARYSVISHVVRLLAGTALRATPMWLWYLRLDGAKIGRGVWVNSLGVTDHCLLELGPGVVIGAGAHLSGHTAERGAIRTDAITLGPGTTIGVNSIIGIGVTSGPGCQVGALSYVPKYTRLDGHTAYGGVPAVPLTAGQEQAP